MKKYHDLSVKVKIPIMLGIASIGVFTLICVMLLIPLRRNTLDVSAQMARYAAELAGERLAVKINASATIVPARASTVSSLIGSELIQPQIKRQTLMNDAKVLVISDVTAVTNCWIIMEPNVIDGMDSLFINQPGCTEKGNLSARWNSTGKLSSADYDANNLLYRQVKQTRQSMMSQPYQDELDGKTVWMITAIAPIIYNGNFCGVVATDYNLAELCDMVNSLNSIGDGKLVTDKGYIVAHRDQTRLGTLAEFGNREILDKLDYEEEFEGFYLFEGRQTYKVYVPIQLGAGEKPWFYAVDVQSEKIYEKAREIVKILVIFFIIGVFLISVAGYFMIRPMLNSVTSVTDIIRQLSLGRINLQIGENRNKDEIGTMKSELNRLLDGLKNTADFAHNIGEGDLNAEYHLLSKDDMLGNSLLEMRKSLQDAEKEQSLRAKEEEQRNWVTAGLAKFAEILRRDNNDMDALSYNVISNMVKYLGVNQGGIFVVNDAESDEDRVLDMKACYAFNRKKFVEKQIHPGEGLVGTCYLEGEPIYMTEVPKEYISITSGLGDANPRTLLICPLKLNDRIFGVIELASFHPFEPYQLDFVQKVSESIAATISTVNVNIRTNRLLEQTKLQAEEMANQEEELRQNMEEMQATQEEMRRREAELHETLARMQEVQAAGEEKEHSMQQFYDGIFATNNVAEFSPDLVVTNVNQNFINLFGMDRSVFIGKRLSVFLSEDAFNATKENVDNGRIHEDVQKMNAGDGKTKIIVLKFVPITDKEGNPQRVLLLVFPEKE